MHFAWTCHSRSRLEDFDSSYMAATVPPNLKGDTHCIGGFFVDGQGGANTVEMALARPRERGSQQVRCGDKGGRGS